MNPKIVIRRETGAGVDAIGEVTVAAFKTLATSSHTEQFVISRHCAPPEPSRDRSSRKRRAV